MGEWVWEWPDLARDWEWRVASCLAASSLVASTWTEIIFLSSLPPLTPSSLAISLRVSRYCSNWAPLTFTQIYHMGVISDQISVIRLRLDQLLSDLFPQEWLADPPGRGPPEHLTQSGLTGQEQGEQG